MTNMTAAWIMGNIRETWTMMQTGKVRGQAIGLGHAGLVRATNMDDGNK